MTNGLSASVRRYAPLWPWLQRLGGLVLIGFWILAPASIPSDAHTYWSIDYADPYPLAWGDSSAFVYSPAFAQLIYPLTLLPFEAFAKVLLAVNLAALAWLLGRAWAAFALLLLPVSSELLVGNVHLLLAVMIVVGLSHPAAWAFGFLTKVTPGLVGVLWFAGRRDWRSIGIASGVTLVIVAASALTWPDAWADWIALIFSSRDRVIENYSMSESPAAVRLPLAAAFAVIAGWRNRPVALPFIVLLALPAIWFSALVLLAAVPRLRRREPPSSAPRT